MQPVPSLGFANIACYSAESSRHYGQAPEIRSASV